MYIKSCEQTIHELARRAEIAFRHKEIALATYLDIVNGASFAKTWSRANAHITSILNNRRVHVSMNLCNIGATVAAGCPQGGVLSPLLWCLLVDDLLSDLRRAGFYAQGYADNITIMVSGRFEGVVSERMQIALRLVETWWRKEGLNVNSSKTTMDGNTTHTARRSLGIAKEIFLGCLINLREKMEWSARSPDLSPCDFSLWGYLKEKVFQCRPSSLEQLKEENRHYSASTNGESDGKLLGTSPALY
ncbi:hypothetical protein Trydic_g7385 [Trypoxylus dichotomus]